MTELYGKKAEQQNIQAILNVISKTAKSPENTGTFGHHMTIMLHGYGTR